MSIFFSFSLVWYFPSKPETEEQPHLEKSFKLFHMFIKTERRRRNADVCVPRLALRWSLWQSCIMCSTTKHTVSYISQPSQWESEAPCEEKVSYHKHSEINWAKEFQRETTGHFKERLWCLKICQREAAAYFKEGLRCFDIYQCETTG